MTLPEHGKLTLTCQGNPDTGIDERATTIEDQANPDERRAVVSPLVARRQSAAEWISSCDPLTVVLWFDPEIDAHGFDALGEYAEMFWLPVIGPTATVTLRRLGRWTDQAPSGLRVNLASLAATLGLGTSTSPNSSLVRTLVRLVDFGLARREDDKFAIRRMVPVVPERLTERFPVGLADNHRRTLAALTAIVS